MKDRKESRPTDAQKGETCATCGGSRTVTGSDHAPKCDGYTCASDCPIPVPLPCPSCAPEPAQSPTEDCGAFPFVCNHPAERTAPADEEGTERIAGPAIMFANNAGFHWQPIGGTHYSVSEEMKKHMPHERPLKQPQGFVTSYGRFVDRREAKQIAEKVGQIVNPIAGGDKLFSEELFTPRPAASDERLTDEQIAREIADAIGLSDNPNEAADIALSILQKHREYLRPSYVLRDGEDFQRDVLPVRCHAAYEKHIDTIRRVAREHGYAIGVHGSLCRDIDLIAAPWVDDASDGETLAGAIAGAVGGVIDMGSVPGRGSAEDHRKPVAKPHGRMAWSIHLGGGPYIDLAVLPKLRSVPASEEPWEQFDMLIGALQEIGSGRGDERLLGTIMNSAIEMLTLLRAQSSAIDVKQAAERIDKRLSAVGIDLHTDGIDAIADELAKLMKGD